MIISLDRNLWLDLIRGCSALLVCLGHLRNATLLDYSALEHPSIVIKVFYAITGLGHQAVMVFFVLSGYFVGGAVLRAGVKFSWVNYLSSRLTRLWVVLIPCLLITWVVGLLLAYYAPEVLVGANFDVWHSGPKQGEYSANFSTFLANIFFMQTIFTPVFGINGPLWSLANEFWYYILFPLLATVIGLVGTGKCLSRVGAILLAMLIIWWLPREMLYGFLIWMLGVGVCLLQPKIKLLASITVQTLLVMALVLFGLALVYSKSAILHNTILIEPDFAVGLTFAFLCLMLTSQAFPSQRWPCLTKCSVYLSEASYSLYLSHFPITVLIAAILYKSARFTPEALVLAQFFGWSLFLLGCSGVVWWLFESRTVFLRTKVNGLLSLISVKIRSVSHDKQ